MPSILLNADGRVSDAGSPAHGFSPPAAVCVWTLKRSLVLTHKIKSKYWLGKYSADHIAALTHLRARNDLLHISVRTYKKKIFFLHLLYFIVASWVIKNKYFYFPFASAHSHWKLMLTSLLLRFETNTWRSPVSPCSLVVLSFWNSISKSIKWTKKEKTGKCLLSMPISLGFLSSFVRSFAAEYSIKL